MRHTRQLFDHFFFTLITLHKRVASTQSQKIIKIKRGIVLHFYYEKNWVNIKQQERIDKGNTHMLDDIPKSFPAMIRSLKLQKRASENGFDWKNPNDTFKKIEEEKQELEIALIEQENEEIEEEIGDLIFSVINLSRKLKIDPENALRKTNNKFSARINYIEKELQKENKKFNQSNLIELERLWNQAKIDVKQVK